MDTRCHRLAPDGVDHRAGALRLVELTGGTIRRAREGRVRAAAAVVASHTLGLHRRLRGRHARNGIAVAGTSSDAGASTPNPQTELGLLRRSGWADIGRLRAARALGHAVAERPHDHPRPRDVLPSAPARHRGSVGAAGVRAPRRHPKAGFARVLPIEVDGVVAHRGVVLGESDSGGTYPSSSTGPRGTGG